MDIYWLGLAVYLQPLIWMFLYSREVPVSPRLVQGAGVGFAAWLLYSGWESGWYTNTLLVTYTLMVVLVIEVYKFTGGFKAVCLGFLVVFVNSWFWEAPIHFADFMEFDGVGTVLLQTFGHLYPVPFLLNTGMKPPSRWWYWSVATWTVILVLTYLRMVSFFPSPWNTVSLYFSRWLGLFTLLWVARYPGQAENTIITRVRNILSRSEVAWRL